MIWSAEESELFANDGKSPGSDRAFPTRHRTDSKISKERFGGKSESKSAF